MEIYKVPIETAVLTFPFIAFILTIPFLIYQYNKYGAIPKIKSLIFYSLILYLLCAYFMVILPLPPMDVVANMKSETMQLMPFNFINDIKITVKFDFSSIDAILQMLNKPTMYTVLFNILLTIPFGIYLKYFFHKKWYQVIWYSFLLSLFFEITQLSGLYGIYPRAYRMFDVDDLITNTLGGFIGYLISPIVELVLPSKEELESRSYEKGKKVTLLRRGVAFTIDLLIIMIINICLKIFLYNNTIGIYSYFISVNLYYMFYSTIVKGQTIGKKIVNLKLNGINLDIKWYHVALRNFLFIYIIFFPYTWINMVGDYLEVSNIIIVIIYIMITIIQIINIIYYLINKKNNAPLFIYEKITHTQNISIISVEKEENEIDNKENNKVSK